VQFKKKNLLLLLLFIFLSCGKEKPIEEISQPGNIKRWEIGQWAEYKVNKGSKEYIVRYTIVDQDFNDTNLFWVESVIKTENDSFLWQTLVPEYFKGSPEELIIVDLTQNTWEALAMPLGQTCKSEFLLSNLTPENIRKTGFETDYVDTDLGELFSLHCKMFVDSSDVNIWINSEIPIYGLVKWEAPNEYRIIIDYGNNESSILPHDIVRIQVSPKDFSKPIFKDNLVSFVQSEEEDTTTNDSISGDSIE